MRISMALLALTLSCLSFVSCKHYCQTNPYPVLKFVNFDSSDLNTVVVTSHSTMSPDLPAVDVKVYSSRNTYKYDTLAFDRKDSSGYYVYLNYHTDATIYIPATGRTYTLMGYTVNRDSWESVHCTNSMTYYLDGNKYTQPMMPSRDAEGVITLDKK